MSIKETGRKRGSKEGRKEEKEEGRDGERKLCVSVSLYNIEKYK